MEKKTCLAVVEFYVLQQQKRKWGQKLKNKRASLRREAFPRRPWRERGSREVRLRELRSSSQGGIEANAPLPPPHTQSAHASQSVVMAQAQHKRDFHDFAEQVRRARTEGPCRQGWGPRTAWRRERAQRMPLHRAEGARR